MKKIQAVLLRHENHLTVPGVVLAFIAGCLTATMCWYFII
jgi:hypothetical protein